jgi:8-oxo-dGTP diphosphatase
MSKEVVACDLCARGVVHNAAQCAHVVTEYVAGFAFSCNRVALILKQRPSWQRGRYNGIGGHVEDGESPRQAMAREFAEETALQTYESDWKKFCTLRGQRDDGHYNVHFFYAELTVPAIGKLPAGGLPVLTKTTDELPMWLPLGAVTINNCMVNLTWLIPMALSMRAENAKEFSVIEIARDAEDILPSRY